MLVTNTPEAIKKVNKRQVAVILLGLKKAYPEAKCALQYATPLQLLIATILSAQCTDKRVNLVTPALFRKYPSVDAFAHASLETLEEMIHSTGFFRNKAKNIREACRWLLKKHNGQVPRSMQELLELSGVARKTANVVLGTAFAISCGVVVDTHVKRLSNRLGLSSQKDPNRIERDLMSRVPQDHWIAFSHQLIHHGRRICGARKPKCAECVLADLCPYRLEISGH